MASWPLQETWLCYTVLQSCHCLNSNCGQYLKNITFSSVFNAGFGGWGWGILKPKISNMFSAALRLATFLFVPIPSAVCTPTFTWTKEEERASKILSLGLNLRIHSLFTCIFNTAQDSSNYYSKQQLICCLLSPTTALQHKITSRNSIISCISSSHVGTSLNAQSWHHSGYYFSSWSYPFSSFS